MKRFLILAAGMMFINSSLSAQNKTAIPVYKNPKVPIEERVKDLLSRMTIEEKAGQLNQLSGAIATGPAANDPGEKAKLDELRKGKVGSFLNVNTGFTKLHPRQLDCE